MVKLGPFERAQVNTGTLSGQVTDASGAVIPAAKLTIQENNTGYTREVTTAGDGNYAFPDLPIASITGLSGDPRVMQFAIRVNW